MQCLACRANNDESEERCFRCGRRLHPAAPRPAPDSHLSEAFPTSGNGAAAAAAPALYPVPGPSSSQQTSDPPSQPVYQRSLFRDAVNGTKVIPIPTLAPLRMPGEAPPRRASSRSVGRPRRSGILQTNFDFPEAQAEFDPHAAGETIVCDAPVAPPLHRLAAATVDASLIFVAVGVVIGIFLLRGPDVALNRQTIPLLLGIAAVLALFYRILWCLGNGDSPGMRFTGLRLVDFDGRRPDRETRLLRQGASLLSVISAGLGLVWALVDEENLTWHDHISKTFPTSTEF